MSAGNTGGTGSSGSGTGGAAPAPPLHAAALGTEHYVGHESQIGAIIPTHNAIRVHQHTKLMRSGDATRYYVRLAMREHIVTQVHANALQSLALRLIASEAVRRTQRKLLASDTLV